MVAEVAAGVGIFANVFQLLRSVKDVTDRTRLTDILNDANERIMDAQSHYFAMEARVREAEEKLARFERWESERVRYELKDVGAGALAYSIKPDAQAAEPLHQICAHCYEDRIKSILQASSRRAPNDGPMRRTLECARCKSVLWVQGFGGR